MLYICLVCLSSFHVFHRIYLYMKLCRRNNSVQVCQCLFHHLQQVSTTVVIFSYPQADSHCGQRQVCESVTSPLHRILRHEAVIGTISRKLVSLLMLCSNLVFCLWVGFHAQRLKFNFVEFAIKQNDLFSEVIL